MHSCSHAQLPTCTIAYMHSCVHAQLHNLLPTSQWLARAAPHALRHSFLPVIAAGGNAAAASERCCHVLPDSRTSQVALLANLADFIWRHCCCATSMNAWADKPSEVFMPLSGSVNSSQVHARGQRRQTMDNVACVPAEPATTCITDLIQGHFLLKSLMHALPLRRDDNCMLQVLRRIISL